MADKEDKEVKKEVVEEKKEEKPKAPKKEPEFQLNVPMEDVKIIDHDRSDDPLKD